MILNLLSFGRISYSDGLDLQRKLVEARHAGQIGNTLVLLEHPPVLTLGRNASRANILASDEFLAYRGVEIHEINRGGDVTYHGPGQLVGYPIFDLRSFAPRLGAVEYVRQIEEALIRACGDFGVPATRLKGRTGVWIPAGGGILEKKIAAIGVHIARGITSHGFAMNVSTDLRDFDLIVPCGISDRAVTGLELEAEPAPSMEAVRNAVARQFGRVFGHQVLAVESVEELLASKPAASSAALG
ncbi:MAG TPA: lipoyl(octanoyl) transferase LipB [Acidobacteriaceae bacterium]|nr:lipoyl(octanoyl) transferase LipB [Acidobacteriaceae bacterium]